MNNVWLQIGVPAASVVLAAIISGISAIISAHKTHKATDAADEAAKKTAEAAIQDTYTRARAQAERDWARHLEAWQKDNERLSREVISNTKRIEDAELRAEAEKVARAKAEHLYWLAITYLRKLIGWIDQKLPGEDHPTPPPELEIDL